MCEAILFASVEPVSIKEMEARMPHGCDAAEAMVHLRKRYEGAGCAWSRLAMHGPFAPRPTLAS